MAAASRPGPDERIERTRRALLEDGAVLCVRLSDGAGLVDLARAAVAGGLRVLELTLTTPGALDAMRALAHDEHALVGGGTVLEVAHVEAVAAAGGRFVFSPVHDPAVLEAARARGLLAVPGAATPTEILAAHHAGARIVKVFPAGALGGPGYLRALRGPLPHVSLLPTSGPTADTLAEYLAAGAVAVGIGAEVIAPGVGPAQVTAAAARVRTALDVARAGLPAPPEGARVDVVTLRAGEGGAACRGLSCRWEGGQYVAVVAPRGIVACGIFDLAVCERFGFAVALAHGSPEAPLVAPDDVLRARVDTVSSAARAAGIEPGMTGAEALARLT